jgi:hypothetical protein
MTKVRVIEDAYWEGGGYLTLGKTYEVSDFRRNSYSYYGGITSDNGEYIYENFTEPAHGYRYEILNEPTEEPKKMEVDIYNINKVWGELTPEEKGALLFHEFEGGKIEWSAYGIDWDEGDIEGFNNLFYRASKSEPRIIRNLYVYLNEDDWNLTKVGTVEMVDGKPDMDTFEPEEI